MLITTDKIKRLFSRNTNEPLYLLSKILGFKPHDIEIYNLAFRHVSCSMVDENGFKINNERLEFLGDSVLSTAISHFLYLGYPNWDEGKMSQRRSGLVKRAVNNAVARELGLGQLLKIKPEALNTSANVYGNTLEALIGAIFLDRGYRYAERFIVKRIFPVYRNLEKELYEETTNYKSILFEWAQKHHLMLDFKTLNEPKHGNGTFVCAVYIDNQRIGLGRGQNKKEAHQQAARHSLEALCKANPAIKEELNLTLQDNKPR